MQPWAHLAGLFARFGETAGGLLRGLRQRIAVHVIHCRNAVHQLPLLIEAHGVPNRAALLILPADAAEHRLLVSIIALKHAENRIPDRITADVLPINRISGIVVAHVHALILVVHDARIFLSSITNGAGLLHCRRHFLP